MKVARWDRLAGPAGGIGFIVLMVLASGYFNPPADDESARKIGLYFLHHHRRGAAASILEAVAVIGFLWLASALATRLWRGGEQRLAATAFAGAVATAATALVGTVIQGALAHEAVSFGNAATTKALYDVESVAFTFIWAPITVLLAATAVAALRSGSLPRWYAFATAFAALVSFSGIAALAQTGFYAPGGGWSFVVFIVFLLWVLATSVELASEQAAPAAATVPPT